MIEIANLSFGYNHKKLLYKDFNLCLQPGNVYGLLGRNGAGKSTLLKNIIGLLCPLSGSITVNGYQPRKRAPAFLSTIYFIPEEVYVPSLSIKRYVQLFAVFYPQFNKAQFDSYLLALGIITDERLDKLSFGQQKKFIIAFSLACNTRVLLLDEPTNGLDIPSKKQFRKLIASVMNEDRMIFISTHQIRDLDNLIDQVIIVDNGELLMNEPLSAIADKLFFGIVESSNDYQEILYSESALKGVAIVAKNTTGGDSKVNLEHLFNATTENPVVIKNIFK
ncbi:MAG: ABC transporter ATP-binding protein [Chitinophagaceae bacterium]